MSEALSWRKCSGLYCILTNILLIPYRVYTCALSSGVSGGIIIAGLISINHGWRTIYWVATALIGTCTLLVIFTFPETMYIRDATASTATVQDDAKQEDIESKQPATTQISDTSVTSNIDVPERRSYVSSLRLFSGIYTKESLWKLFTRPIALIILPQALWATLVMSGTIGFLVAISSNFATAFTNTYGFEPWQSGLCFIAALMGAFIGIFFGGHLSDWVADRQTQRNGGVREPEMRLPAILVSVVTAPLALILYGVGIQYKLHWMCPTISLALSKFNPVRLIG